MSSANLLWRTRTYLIGHMEHVSSTEGESWRDRITPALEKMGIVVFNPYHKPFIHPIQEGPREVAENLELRRKGELKQLQLNMKDVVEYDLSLVHRSDFLIAHIKPNVPSWGSADELYTAIALNKPIFLSVDGGTSSCPLWFFGKMDPEYIYDSPEAILNVLQRIDKGEEVLSSFRWRLYRKEWR